MPINNDVARSMGFKAVSTFFGHNESNYDTLLILNQSFFVFNLKIFEEVLFEKNRKKMLILPDLQYFQNKFR